MTELTLTDLAADIASYLIPVQVSAFGINCTYHHDRWAVAIDHDPHNNRNGRDTPLCVECVVRVVVGRVAATAAYDLSSNPAYSPTVRS